MFIRSLIHIFWRHAQYKKITHDKYMQASPLSDYAKPHKTPCSSGICIIYYTDILKKWYQRQSEARPVTPTLNPIVSTTNYSASKSHRHQTPCFSLLYFIYTHKMLTSQLIPTVTPIFDDGKLSRIEESPP